MLWEGRKPGSGDGYRDRRCPVSDSSDLPAPGWYVDPERSETWRYWNGAAWTKRRTPMLIGTNGEVLSPDQVATLKPKRADHPRAVFWYPVSTIVSAAALALAFSSFPAVAAVLAGLVLILGGAETYEAWLRRKSRRSVARVESSL